MHSLSGALMLVWRFQTELFIFSICIVRVSVMSRLELSWVMISSALMLECPCLKIARFRLLWLGIALLNLVCNLGRFGVLNLSCIGRSCCFQQVESKAYRRIISIAVIPCFLLFSGIGATWCPRVKVSRVSVILLLAFRDFNFKCHRSQVEAKSNGVLD